MNIPVNKHAPVFAEDQITIATKASDVWEVLTAIEAWPKWQSDVSEAQLKGALAEKTEFVWKAGGLKFRSKIHTMNHGAEFGWTGRTLGASAIHNWTFTESKGSTTILVEECLQGIFPSLFRKYFQKNLILGLKKNLEELKAAAEKQ